MSRRSPQSLPLPLLIRKNRADLITTCLEKQYMR